MKALISGCGVGLSALLFAACEGPLPTAPGQLHLGENASLSAVALAPCHAVRGTITAVSVPGGAVGTIQGDLQGLITTVLGPDPVGDTERFITGAVFHLSGHQTVEVEGSSIPELVGRTIIWTIQTRAIHLPPIRRVSSTLRIIEGATGNLTSHGILDLATLTTHFQYEGVICP